MATFEASRAMLAEARTVMPGGVNSNARLADAPGGPLFIERGDGARIVDVDGNVLIDYVMGNGAAILGHAPPGVLAAVAANLARGQTFAAQHPDEVALCRRLAALIPCAERVRLAISGSEAVHATLRLARAFTGRRKIIKFEGHYHGWLDNILISVRPPLNEAGPAEAPVPVPMSRGIPPAVLDDVIVLPWNDADALAAALEHHGRDVAGVIMEPVLCNCGVIPPRPGYLERARETTRRAGALLIFDEVITGFRFGLAGAQGMFGVTPDLAAFAKAVAAGFPLAFIAGRADVMELLAPEGHTVHSGTYNACLPAVVAASATLDVLAADGGAVYARMRALGERLAAGLRAAARRHGVPLLVQGIGPVFATLVTDQTEVTDFRAVARADAGRLAKFVAALARHGVRTTARGIWFVSAAHDDAMIDATLVAADAALADMASA
ncbi:MAG: aspartate aminotransferase family protein [Alphaproteobacteria bacterium]